MKRLLLFLAIFSLLAVGLASCNEKKSLKDEYKSVCATVRQTDAHLDCWSILIESEESIGNLNPIDGIFVFWVDYLPNEFKVDDIRVTTTFRLTEENRQCGFGRGRVIEILTIKKCN